MRLNEKIPGLPPWPSIDMTGENEYLVHGKHISYRNYVSVKRMIVLIVLIAWGLTFRYYYDSHEPIDGPVVYEAHHYDTHRADRIMRMIGVFVGGLIIVPIMLCLTIRVWMTRLFKMDETKVCFTPQAVIIGRGQYDISINIPVEFKSNRPTLVQKPHMTQQMNSSKSYEFGFRNIEMVYGMGRIVFINSIDDEDRAASFAIALQIAYKLAKESRGRGRR